MQRYQLQPSARCQSSCRRRASRTLWCFTAPACPLVWRLDGCCGWKCPQATARQWQCASRCQSLQACITPSPNPRVACSRRASGQCVLSCPAERNPAGRVWQIAWRKAARQISECLCISFVVRAIAGATPLLAPAQARSRELKSRPAARRKGTQKHRSLAPCANSRVPGRLAAATLEVAKKKLPLAVLRRELSLSGVWWRGKALYERRDSRGAGTQRVRRCACSHQHAASLVHLCPTAATWRSVPLLHLFCFVWGGAAKLQAMDGDVCYGDGEACNAGLRGAASCSA